MPRLYVKASHESSRTEVAVEQVEELPVKDLRAILAEKLDIPLEELFAIYGGRVLKPGKNLGHYKVSEGCTIHIIRKKKKEVEPPPSPPSGFGSIITNPRVQRAIGRVLSNPSLIQAMISGTPLVESSLINQTLSSPELLSGMAEPGAIADYLRNNPEMAILTEGILRMYSLLFGGERDMNPGDETDVVDMLEGNLEEDMEEASEERLQRLARQQEQMFEYSQALRAHQRRQRTEQAKIEVQQPPVPDQSSASQQHGSVEVTRDIFASAISSAQNSVQPSPMSSLTTSGPPSLSTPLTSTHTHSGPPSLSTPHTSTAVHGENVPQQSEQVGTITSEGGGVITTNALQQALASALSNTQQQQQQQQQVQESQQWTPPEQQLPLSDQYRAHLEQLHIMGITDDAACLHALEATGGDIQAALEILLGSNSGL